MSRAILPLPQYVFMAWRFVKHRDNFAFTHTREIRLFIAEELLVTSF